MTDNHDRQIISEFCDLANSGRVPMTCFGNDRGGVSVLFDGKFVNLPPVVARITTMEVPLIDELQDIWPITYKDIDNVLFWPIDCIGLPTRIENALNGYSPECFDKIEFVGDLMYIFKRLSYIPNIGKVSIRAARKIIEQLVVNPDMKLTDWPKYREDYVQSGSKRPSKKDIEEEVKLLKLWE